MFVTNHGNFGRDLSGFFGYDCGTFFPFVDAASIRNGFLINYPLYAAGLWVGGIDSATGQLRVAVAEYSDEYVPGPMVGGTFLPDNPDFKVYKLYRDSLAGNPNYDYLHWPVGQGAPVDPLGHPIMLGDRMLWCVYNDADLYQHNNNSGSTTPLGIEVQQTVWAADKNGSIVIPLENFLDINQLGYSRVTVSALITDPLALTGNEYMVVVDTLSDSTEVWSLINKTTGQILAANQTNFSGDDNYPVFDGFKVIVTETSTRFSNFEVVANASGPLDPPEGAASTAFGFPSELPTDRQQVGGGIWLFHTADSGGSCGGGTRGSYDTFISRVTRDGQDFARIGRQDYEMRFTGSYDNPGVGGSYAIEGFNGYTVLWVPFELWRIGIGTPDDPNDDVRMIPCLLDQGNDNTYNLESWGCINDVFGGDGEHSVSSGDDDPFTDWVYWYFPSDSSPGQAGYQKDVIKMLSGTYELSDREILARTVLVNWNGGVQPPFNQSLPEEGTIFRITTGKGPQPDSFSFTATPIEMLTTGPEGLSIYIRYKIFNKGSDIINNCYLSLWSDPDLGGAGDDFVGTDTSNDIFFCYNADNNDKSYGALPPAIGFKFIYGPVVPSAGDSAIFDGSLIADYKNLGMTASARYINGIDPDNAWESYFYMQGIDRYGSPYSNGTKFMFPGDPIFGTGDLDSVPSDRRMTAGCGPFDFRPGDSQYVLIKMAVGLGTDRLSSITKLKEILNYSSDFCIDLDANGKVNMLDITYLINFLYKVGLAPIAPSTGDADGDGKVNMKDITHIIRYLYKGGPPPNCR